MKTRMFTMTISGVPDEYSAEAIKGVITNILRKAQSSFIVRKLMDKKTCDIVSGLEIKSLSESRSDLPLRVD